MVDAPERIWGRTSCKSRIGRTYAVKPGKDDIKGFTEYVRADLFAALEAQLAERVKVKPLEWKRDEYGCFHAETEIGEYIAWPNGRAQFGPFRTTHVNGGEKGAMAAGEADYQRRIRSTLSDAVVEREVEPVDDEKPRYTTKRLRYEIERARQNDAFELEALRKRVAELEKALEPFAEYIRRFDEHESGGVSNFPDEHWAKHGNAVGGIQWGHLRTARRVREGGKVE